MWLITFMAVLLFSITLFLIVYNRMSLKPRRKRRIIQGMSTPDIKNAAKDRMRQAKLFVRHAERFGLLTRFIDYANTKARNNYFDVENAQLEMEFLAEVASHVFEAEIRVCPTCVSLLPSTHKNTSCSVECAQQFRQFCREERARERNGRKVA